MELIFEWDLSKARSNLRKHKVSFEEAKSVFEDESLVTYADESHSEREERYISIGKSSIDRMLLVVHTEVDDADSRIIIRIISSRRATAKERLVYEEQRR